MQSFTEVNIAKMALAETSKITTSNNRLLGDLMKCWKNGDYDESPELLVQEIETLLS
jgi:hypothetical protein